jgi:hypothetical protein
MVGSSSMQSCKHCGTITCKRVDTGMKHGFDINKKIVDFSGWFFRVAYIEKW